MWRKNEANKQWKSETKLLNPGGIWDNFFLSTSYNPALTPMKFYTILVINFPIFLCQFWLDVFHLQPNIKQLFIRDNIESCLTLHVKLKLMSPDIAWNSKNLTTVWLWTC